VSDLVKTLRTAPIALLGLVLALAVIGSSCSATNPVALQVGQWQLSDSDLEVQLSSFADVYAEATSQEEADQALRAQLGVDGDGESALVSWSTAFTAQFLNDQLNLQLARIAADERGIEITQDDRDAARRQLEQNYASQSGESVFGQLDEDYQETLVDGIAAQNLVVDAILGEGVPEDLLRQLFEAGGERYSEPQACVSHILVLAGESNGQATPTDAEYAAALTEIEALQAQLDAGADFAEVAAASSEDGSAASGGDLGCAPEGTYVPGFEETVWSQPVGEVSEPVQTTFGYHLVLVRSRGIVSFEDVRSSLEAQVEENPELLLQAELARTARDVGVTVDGRYGDYDEATAQITTPAGPSLPSTTVPGLDQLLESGAQ
jgi:parvulin-like peptidyl-prolyl isomerase